MWRHLQWFACIVFIAGSQLSHTCRATYLTVKGRSDGFGGQLHGQLSCLLMTKMIPNLTYAHTPMETLEHIKSPADWDRVRQIEVFTNVGYDEIPISQVPDDEVVENRAYCHEYTEGNLQLYELFKGELLRKFAANKRMVKIGRKVTGHGGFPVEVHVHIRRGDIDASSGRYISVDTYHDMLSGIKKGLDVHDISMDVHVHSEGSEDDFAKLVERFDAVLHLNEDVLQTWYAQISAHVLVLSRSSLSYTAGLYNQGIVVYSPFHHGALPTWFVYNDDPDNLEKRFAEHRTRDLLRNRVQNARRIRFAGVINRYVTDD